MGKMKRKNPKVVEKVVSVNGFTVIPIKFCATSSVGHNLYIKEHRLSRETDPRKPIDRTLFVVNVPPYCNEGCLRRIFSECGKVHHVVLQDKAFSNPPTAKGGEKSEFFKKVKVTKGFQYAYIVFTKPGSIKKAEEMPFGEPRILSTEEKPVVTGIKKWCQEYQASHTLDTKELQKEIDAYMAEFDRKKAEEEEREKKMEGVPDEEGWVTVTRHGKNKGIPRTEAAEKKILARDKKRRKDRELLNFYAFQQRECKREHIADLRKKFEEDKQRIALMKTARRFRPY